MTQTGQTEMNENKKTNRIMYYIILGLLIIFIVTIFTNYFAFGMIPYTVSHSQPSAWIGYFGSILGCSLGGAIGGYIAYIIASKQIEVQKESLNKENNDRIKRDLQIETAKNVNEPIVYFQKHLQMLYSHMRRLIIFSVKYQKDLTIVNNGSFDFEREFQNLIGLLEVNLQNLDDQQAIMSKIIFSRIIILNKFYGEIIKFVTLNEELNTSVEKIKLFLAATEDAIHKSINIDQLLTDDLLNEFNNVFITKAAELEKLMFDLALEINNEFLSDLFEDHKYEIPNLINRYKPLNI
ncbi:hypothetical protein [Desulfosporosinus sp. FKA]|uniref:hypothetical protein n=1 Tax=Desulfosporosinus sp. FKA TaxID=1969834 RepID=UPI000B498230|nr:hypothetical protein [Desulfosporosinus sp. FKA]